MSGRSPGPGRIAEEHVVARIGQTLEAFHGKIIEELGVEYDPRGNIRCNPDYSTSAKGVFAAGDANTGASLVVRAIFHGREAARNIDNYLKG